MIRKIAYIVVSDGYLKIKYAHTKRIKPTKYNLQHFFKNKTFIRIADNLHICYTVDGSIELVLL